MQKLNQCPKCEDTEILLRTRFHDRVNDISFDADGYGTNVNIDSQPDKEHYYRCRSCPRSFIPINRNMNDLISKIQLTREERVKVLKQIYTCYNEFLQPEDLLLKNNNGVIRTPEHMLSKIKNHFKSDPIYVAVKYNEQITCAMIVKEKNRQGMEYFTIANWTNF